MPLGQNGIMVHLYSRSSIPKQAAHLNKILQRKAYNKLGLLKKDNGTLTETVEESYKILMAEHFPGCQLLPVATVHDHDGPNPTGATGRHNHPVLVDQKEWINLNTIHHAFSKFGSDKCPGPDGFRPVVLMHLPVEARKALIGIYNAVLELR
jgi:hypothetical protein